MALAVMLAIIVDLAFGEPRGVYHPIAIIGRAMAAADRRIRPRLTRPAAKKLAGLAVTVCFTVGSYLLAAGAISLAARWATWLGWGVEAVFIWLSISLGELTGLNRKINERLDAGRLDEAGSLVRRLVGRDTDDMSGDQIRTAALESLAENLVDAGIAPIFYALLGGGALAFAYRITNTLDSMFGYKNADYIDFGWSAARLDDLASWLPARIVVLSLSLASFLSGRDFKTVLSAVRVDGRKHASPNSGLAMAAMAGALDIRLGGVRRYEGEARLYGYFGDGREAFGSDVAVSANSLAVKALIVTTFIGLAVGAICKGYVWLIR